MQSGVVAKLLPFVFIGFIIFFKIFKNLCGGWIATNKVPQFHNFGGVGDSCTVTICLANSNQLYEKGKD